MASTLPMGGENAPSVRYTTREEAAEAVRAARTNAGRFQLEYVGEASRHAEEMRGTTEDWMEEVSERLHALGERQWRFHEEVAASRTLLEEELGRAREASRHGAKMAKEAVMRCLHRCETLRAGLLNDVRELAASTSGEGMQLSRRFHRSWMAVTECGERAFQYLVDFDRFVALYVNHRPTRGPGLETVEAAFEALGAGGDSAIDRASLVRALTTSGEAMTREELDAAAEALLGPGATAEDLIPEAVTARDFAEETLGFHLDLGADEDTTRGDERGAEMEPVAA